jgi:hypothetical protein
MRRAERERDAGAEELGGRVAFVGDGLTVEGKRQHVHGSIDNLLVYSTNRNDANSSVANIEHQRFFY